MKCKVSNTIEDIIKEMILNYYDRLVKENYIKRLIAFYLDEFMEDEKKMLIKTNLIELYNRRIQELIRESLLEFYDRYSNTRKALIRELIHTEYNKFIKDNFKVAD